MKNYILIGPTCSVKQPERSCMSTRLVHSVPTIYTYRFRQTVRTRSTFKSVSFGFPGDFEARSHGAGRPIRWLSDSGAKINDQYYRESGMACQHNICCQQCATSQATCSYFNKIPLRRTAGSWNSQVYDSPYMWSRNSPDLNPNPVDNSISSLIEQHVYETVSRTLDERRSEASHSRL